MDTELIRMCEQLTFSVATAVTAKPLLERLLGPSFDYAGKAMADLLARYGNKNVRTIFRVAAARVDELMLDRGVSPRVLKAVIEEGCFADDSVTQEYFAGLLAASFSGDISDDEAVTFVNIVRNLTAAQIKFHHMMYSLKRVIFNPPHFRALPADVDGEMFIPHDIIQIQTGASSVAMRRNIVRGLAHERLIAAEFKTDALAFDPAEQGSIDGVIVAGTSIGAELFLWVHGARGHAPEAVCQAGVPLQHWSGESLRRRFVLRGCHIAQLRHVARTLDELERLCGSSPNLTALMKTEQLLRLLLRSKERIWLPRTFRSWAASLPIVNDSDLAVSLKARVTGCRSMISVGAGRL